jgi:hypothetical protein
MALTISILGFLGVVIPVVWWAWKRNVAPDARQRLDDIDRRMEELREKIETCRQLGDDAGADAYVRQLLQLGVERAALGGADGEGQRRDD